MSYREVSPECTSNRSISMMRVISGRFLLCGCLVLALTAASGIGWAQGANPIIYPSNGQSPQQQGNDEAQCRQWAQQQTGFNPSANLPPGYSGGQQGGGKMVGGAARGALLGTIGGAIGGDVGRGAAIGAGVGAASGLMQSGRQRRQAEQQQQQAMAQYENSRASYVRAFGVCMKGRGYTVG